MTTIHLVRHGEVHNPDRILYLRLPGMYLSESGHRQARCVAQILKLRPTAAVMTSPMPRAVQTADYIAHEHGLMLECSRLLNEIYSPYEGYPIEKIERIGWDLYTGVTPPYERWEDVLGRVQQFCGEMCAAHPGQEVVAVTHGDIVVTAALWARGLPLSLEGRRHIPYPGHASITTLVFNTADHPFDAASSRPEWRYDDRVCG
jgi:broad specificity phosphatase PhoE